MYEELTGHPIDLQGKRCGYGPFWEVSRVGAETESGHLSGTGRETLRLKGQQNVREPERV
jgi:hypothetical protein